MLNQLSIFVENTTGRLAEITGILEKHKISIRGLSISDTSEFGILRMIVNKPDNALGVLRQAGITALETPVIGVCIEDSPGGLAKVMQIFKQDGDNIEYLYATMEKSDGHGVVIFKVKELEKGIQLLREHKIPLLEEFQS